MTIASEITRLQNDKAAICTAIENKGVTVGNVTLDSYASCIDAIQTGGGGIGIYRFNYLLVGGGGGGGNTRGEGGGGGDVCYGEYYTMGKNIPVCVGGGGRYGAIACDGCQSQIGLILARGGYGGSCSGGGGCSGNYNVGGTRCSTCAGGGGGGAGGDGANYSTGRGGRGGLGVYGYGGGGGGGGVTCGGCGCGGGGNGGDTTHPGCDATGCGGGGGGGGCGTGNTNGGCGAGGVAIICYSSDGSDGITCATGGTITTSGNYTVHTFTSDGTFTIVE